MENVYCIFCSKKLSDFELFYFGIACIRCKGKVHKSIDRCLNCGAALDSSRVFCGDKVFCTDECKKEHEKLINSI